MPTEEPTSDLQFVAQVLARTRRGDQVTRAQAHRLDEIAEFGHTKGTPLPDDRPTVAVPVLPSGDGGV